MLISSLIFVGALLVLLFAAKKFTEAAEQVGYWLKLPAFVIGIFIVGIGTSLPELISGLLAVSANKSSILAGNVVGSNISNLLFITGAAVAYNRKNIELKSSYIYIDLHFLLGAFFYAGIIMYDGVINPVETIPGLIIFLIYSFYLIKGGSASDLTTGTTKNAFPWRALGWLLAAGVGIYFGAEYTIESLSTIAQGLHVPDQLIALTLLSLGTTLPELAVNISAIQKNNPEMAMGNILGSCIFNTLVIPTAGSWLGTITIPADLLGFALPVMAGSGLLFYLLAQDKKISTWEGLLFAALYVLFLLKLIGF